jgi:hypothetical protein
VKSISEWLNQVRISPSLGYEVGTTTIASVHFGAILATVSRRQPGVIPQGTVLAYFFEIDGRLIEAALVYRGKKRSSYFEESLMAVIKNLEP